MTLNIASSGPPKIRKNASKKNKKSWRKNVDMTEVEDFLEEQRFEERIGGSFTEKKDQEIFMLDTGGEDRKEKKKRKKEIKPLKCHSLLQGLPGVPDPKPMRRRTRTLDQRMNPVVKQRIEGMISAGIIPRKMVESKKDREMYLQMKKRTAAERQTRRRTKFDFDLWDQTVKPGEEISEQDSWITPETRTHRDIWTSQHIPKETQKRNFSTGTLLPAIELPHPGSSYNPALADHQDLLWQAAMVEFDKEKEKKRIERATTAMYPTKSEAPTEQTMMQEMAEGIAELGGKVDDEVEEKEDEEEKKDEEETEGKETSKMPKPKTRKQRRDERKRGFEERKMASLLAAKRIDDQVFLVKSLRKKLSAADTETVERQKRKEERRIEKLKNPVQHSRYKYDAPEIEIKLSDELTGNLRNLKPEGSLLEDRYKSLQRRNIVETRIIQKQARHKIKKVDKRSHKMAWEADISKLKQAAAKTVKNKKKKMKALKRAQAAVEAAVSAVAEEAA